MTEKQKQQRRQQLLVQGGWMACGKRKERRGGRRREKAHRSNARTRTHSGRDGKCMKWLLPAFARLQGAWESSRKPQSKSIDSISSVVGFPLANYQSGQKSKGPPCQKVPSVSFVSDTPGGFDRAKNTGDFFSFFSSPNERAFLGSGGRRKNIE